MINRLICILSFIGLLAWSCTKDEEKNPVVLTGLVIKTGRACGWCAGRDSLTITKTQGYYGYYPACTGKIKNINEQTDTAQWNALLDKLDLDKFKSIDINTCNLCVDGCDTWITIQKDDVIIHKIRFGDNSKEIEPIRTFVEELDTWRKAFKSK